MTMAWFKCSGFVLALLAACTSEASIITYLIEGSVVKVGGSTNSSDYRQIDGGKLLWTLEIEADDYVDRVVRTDSTTTIFASIAESIVFKRIGGLPDLVTAMPTGQSGGDATMRDVVENTPETCSGCFERVTFQGGFALDIADMEVTGVGLNLPASFFSGDTSFPRHLTIADAESYDFGGDWSIRTQSPGLQDLYQVVDVTVTMVPIPAAAWLFASALGLLGWIRPKSRGTDQQGRSQRATWFGRLRP